VKCHSFVTSARQQHIVGTVEVELLAGQPGKRTQIPHVTHVPLEGNCLPRVAAKEGDSKSTRRIM